MTAHTHGLSIPVYAAAHFGKSLWRSGSELFLAFFLTEYLALSGMGAAIGIVLGLLLGAVLDIVVARHGQGFASVAWAGRVQMGGAIGAAASVALLAAAPLATGMGRWAVVVASNLIFRLAYVFYDLPQNCLMSLVCWSPDERRWAAAARTAASAAALIAISLGMATSSPRGMVASTIFVVGAIVVALASSAALLVHCRNRTDQTIPAPAISTNTHSIGWGVLLMVATCLTVPAFGKLAPYLSIGGPQPAIGMLVVILSAATGLSQLGWPILIRRIGEVRSTALAGGLLLVGGGCVQLGTLAVAGLCVGTASGALTTIIWSHVSIVTAGRDRLAVAPAFAWLFRIDDKRIDDARRTNAGDDLVDLGLAMLAGIAIRQFDPTERYALVGWCVACRQPIRDAVHRDPLDATAQAIARWGHAS